MKRQKRGKCKLWRSFTNIFKRRRSTDGIEAAQEPFSDGDDVFTPPKVTEEVKIQPLQQTAVAREPKPKKPDSPIKQKPTPLKPAGQFAGDLDVVKREEKILNTDKAKDIIRLRQQAKRLPGKYNQQKSPESDSPGRSTEDLTTVHTESQDESQNSKDGNSASSIHALGAEQKPDSPSTEGELSSSSRDSADWSAKSALLANKPLPEAPKRQPMNKEMEEQAEIKRIPSKKKMASSRSEEAKRLCQSEKSTDPEIVNLPISGSQGSGTEHETEAKAAKEAKEGVKESSGAVVRPETRLISKTGDNSKIRISRSMKEVRHLAEMESRPGADNAAAEGSKLSSSVKDKQPAGKAESLNVESKPATTALESSTLESKSKAAKQHEAALPQLGSLQKLSKTDVKPKTEDLSVAKAESSSPDERSNSEAKMDKESSLKRPKRRESKLKAEGKKVEGVLAPPTESNSIKRGSSRGNSSRRSRLMSQDTDAESAAKNSAREESKKMAESKKETQREADPAESVSILTPVTDLSEKHEPLTGKASGDQTAVQKASDRASDNVRVSALQDPNRGSKLIEGRADDRAAASVSVSNSRERLNGVSQEDAPEVRSETKSNQQIKSDGGSRKQNFVTPAVPTKALQKARAMGKSIEKDVPTAAVAEAEVKIPGDETAAADGVLKRASRIPDEGSMKELNKVLHKVQNKPVNGSIESTPTSVEASPAIKTENKGDAAIENALVKPAKILPVPPKAFRRDLGSSQKVTPGDGKAAAVLNQPTSLSSSMNGHSRTPSVTSGEGKIPSENAEAEKPKGDVATSVVAPKCPPPVVSRSGKVQPKAVENAKEADAAWIGKAKRMSKDFSDKMLKIETKVEEKIGNGEVETDDNFERGGTRSSVKDMIKKLQKQNLAS